jgi:quinol monooxygenase YgiN
VILITIKMQIRPDRMDQWLALADSYARDVNSEDGCLFFQFARSLTDDNEFICIEGFTDADAGGAHVKQPYVKKFFEAAPDLVAAQPQIIYIDTPHDGFGPMGEIQPRLPAEHPRRGSARLTRTRTRTLLIATGRWRAVTRCSPDRGGPCTLGAT